MSKGKELSKGEKEFLKMNAGKDSVSALAREIGRDRRTVAKFFKDNNVNTKVKKEIKGETDLQNFSRKSGTKSRKTLSETEREVFFRETLENSKYYDNLKKQFTEEEMDYYLEEWAALCLQFEDIVNTDKRQIDEYIKTGIIGNRILRNIRETEDVIGELIEETDLMEKVKELDDDEDAQKRYDDLCNMVMRFSTSSQGMVNDYQKNQEARAKLLESLNTRRKDRVNQIKKSGTSFFDLIQTLDEPEYRDDQGYYLELMKVAKDGLKHDWRDPSLFPDGTKDAVLIDEHSIEPQVQIVELKQGSVETIKSLSVGGQKLNVIVCHSAASLFPNALVRALSKHNVIYTETYEEFVLQAQKDEKQIHYVILGYYLNDDRDCRDAVRYIVENDLMENTKFFITSNGQTFIDEVVSAILGLREFEQCLTEEIEEKFNGKNSNGNREKGSNNPDA